MNATTIRVIWDEGEELEITVERAVALIGQDLIYACDEHSSEGQIVYHIMPDHTWEEVDPR